MEFDSLLKLVGNEAVFESSMLMAGDVNPKLIRIWWDQATHAEGSPEAISDDLAG